MNRSLRKRYEGALEHAENDEKGEFPDSETRFVTKGGPMVMVRHERNGDCFLGVGEKGGSRKKPDAIVKVSAGQAIDLIGELAYFVGIQNSLGNLKG